LSGENSTLAALAQTLIHLENGAPVKSEARHEVNLKNLPIEESFLSQVDETDAEPTTGIRFTVSVYLSKFCKLRFRHLLSAI
jgi:hypothetical protein